jgi:hypothetical protein
MNPELTNKRPVWHVGLGFVGASFLFAILVLALKFFMPTPAIDADRAAERSKDLAQIRAAETRALESAGWIDQQRGLVRLPIETAMQLMSRQAPASSHADLIRREQQASAPAPATPAKPNAFE